MGADLRREHINLLRDCLTRTLFPEKYLTMRRPTLIKGKRRFVRLAFWNVIQPIVQKVAGAFDLELVRVNKKDPALRQEGYDWPGDAETMVGLKRLDNLRDCIEDVLRNEIPGDLIETGVWRGGSCIFMRAALKTYGDPDRIVWVADSFEGLPKASGEYVADNGSWYWEYNHVLAVSLAEVKANFRRYGMLDERVRFLKGWFKETLPTAPIERLAILRLDGDMYESTIDVLRALYPKLSAGGYCIIDDYALDECKKAVTDYRAVHGITDPLHMVDWTGAYWKKT
jgi:O-methyltransferase